MFKAIVNELRDVMNDESFSFLFFVTNAVIIVWSAYAACRRTRRFDFHTMFHLFSLFFFGIAPLVQWCNGLKLAPLYDEGLSASDFLRANLVILSVLALFEIVYCCFHRLQLRQEFLVRSPDFPLRLSTKAFWLFVVGAAVLVFLWYQKFNPVNLLLRGGTGERENAPKAVLLVCCFFCRYLPLSAAMIYQLCGRHRKTLGVILWTLGVVCCFPTGMARLQVVPVYLPAAMLLVPYLRERKHLLVTIFVGGLLVVFPFLNLFRKADIDVRAFRLFDFSFFNSLHFDSFASLAFILKQDFVTGGRQLLGALLFWFPRCLWPGKPIESGRLLAETFGLGLPNGFTNIAVNWFGEGYLNFGWLGIVLWCVTLAAICGFWDAHFWSDKRHFDRTAVLYYFSGVGFLFFLLRGDMMNGVAFMTGLLASHRVMETIMLKKVSDA